MKIELPDNSSPSAESGAQLLKDLGTIAGADPRDLGERQLSSLRQFLLADRGGLFAFCWLIFGYRDLKPELHGEICNLLGMWKRDQDSNASGYSRLLVQIPREFFKTSVCTRANALWQVCRGFYSGQDDAVAIFNEKLDNPSKWLRAIKDVVQSSKEFQVIFRDILPPGIAIGDSRNMPRWWKWSDTEILFQRNQPGIPEASITGLGITAASTGGHWPTIIKDDIISVEASHSVSVMDYAKDWFDTSLYLERPAMKGRDLIVCTPWTFDDVYNYAILKYDYKVYRRSAIENGVSIFPEKLSTEELLKYQSKKPKVFAAQMQCKPVPDSDQNFLYEWLKWGQERQDGKGFLIDEKDYDPDLCLIKNIGKAPRFVPYNVMNKCLLFDPAPSEERDKNKEKNARNAVVVEGHDPWGRRFVLDSWADRLDPLDVLEKLFQICEKWGTNQIAIEEVNFSKLYRPMLLMYNKLRGSGKEMHLRFIQLDTKRQDKDTRITAMIPRVKSGLYFVNKVGTERFVQEYAEYPFGATRDLLDAWAYDYRITRPKSTDEIQWEKEQKISGRGRGTIDQVTGY